MPAGKWDGNTIVAHEMGHALGLSHSDSETLPGGNDNGWEDLMDNAGPHNADCGEGEPFVGRRITDISDDDRDGIVYLYSEHYTSKTLFANADCVS